MDNQSFQNLHDLQVFQELLQQHDWPDSFFENPPPIQEDDSNQAGTATVNQTGLNASMQSPPTDSTQSSPSYETENINIRNLHEQYVR